MGGFKSNSRAWLASESKVLKRAEVIMAGVMVTRGTMLVTKRSGDLGDSGRVEQEGGVTSAVFGGNGVLYGRIQDLGGITGRNHRTKIRPQHYLEQAGDSVAKENPKKYVDMAR